jgi:hypothetical protein
LSRGDELALHGYTHIDDGPAPASVANWFARRILTAGEAEFASLGKSEARARIETGLELFAACGWQPAGFVPPAWQISAAALEALREFSGSLQYTSTLGSISALPEGRSFDVPCLGYSARSRARRALSIAWNRLRLARLEAEPLLRIALHPVDAEHDNTLAAWRTLLLRTLRDRKPVTKSMLVQSAMRLSRHQRPMMPRREPVS